MSIRPSGRRSIAGRVLRFSWRCVRVLLMAFAAMGPAPPPLPPPPPPAVELRVDAPRPGARRLR